ncbi:MAG: NUDIX hydrolase [Candidatus Bipolaricaulota bacterium]|nr:NUDIX hydrolase [Candidatus Bipolaricaulota bacterium]MCS7274470.1 NUDIX hydrolase [Candidatus Bipolaricaulota bacterium]MDW8110899.1 NUDIX hydrolase [Candidatus Bipolaricaulota bacterium]MDW8329334.1 NUDIX hydrolase [Candidatus Bipolaricaulota bacterium]
MSGEESYRSERVFRGRLLAVRVEEVVLADGRRARREIVEHPGAVAILAVDDQQRVALVRQFRRAADQELWEVPAGTLEPGEAPLECARRELQEETGFSANEWQPLLTFYTAPGFCTEKMYLFLAQELRPVAQKTEIADEQIEVRFYSKREIETMLPGLHDAKTLVALLWWLHQNR